jgi:hypothetical protein
MADEKVQELQGRRVVQGNTPREEQAELGLLEKPAEFHRAVLERIRHGLGTKVRILANHDSCPVCRVLEGAYDFEKVPELPIEGCSHPNGCRCHYEPVLDRFGP